MRPEAARRVTEARARGGVPIWVLGLLLLALGFGLGLIYGWVIDPVVITDVDPPDLRQEWQEAWVLMTAQSLAVTGDELVARQRLETFDDQQLAQLLSRLISGAQDDQTRQQLSRLAQLRNLPITEAGAPSGVPSAQVPPEEPATSPARLLLLICGALLGLILVGVGLLILWTRLQVNRRGIGRKAASRPERPASYSPPATPAPVSSFEEGASSTVEELDEGDEEEFFDLGELGQDEEGEFREIRFDEPASEPSPVSRPPTAPRPAAAALDQFVARYNLGDKDYDINFVIETPTAEFLGECGVAVSEVLDDGPPQRVTALEIWLFDKDDIRTVTKVLLSAHAAVDEAIRSRLAPKGEAVEAREGETIELETASLVVQARLREVGYGWDPQYPEKSYFERVVIELVPMQKSAQSGRPAIEY